MCGVVHTSIKVFADRFYEELVRRVYTTPKSYLDLINSYTAKLGQLQGAVETKASQMEASGSVLSCLTKQRGRGGGDMRGVYSFAACLGHLTIDHAFLSRRNTDCIGGGGPTKPCLREKQ